MLDRVAGSPRSTDYAVDERRTPQVPPRPDPRPAAAHAEFRRDIEALRAIAVTLVVAFHARLAPWGGGFVGVDVFFVLSGYLITGLLRREVDATGSIRFAAFYARRARRLLPAAVLMLAATIIASVVVYSPLEQGSLLTSRVRLATALYASNIAFARHATDYFGNAGATDPLLHTWSLSAEEQFYLVWPFLVWLLYRGRRGSRALLVVGLATVSVVSLAVGLLSHLPQPWLFFGTPFRVWQFGAGALAGLVPTGYLQRRVSASTWSAIGWLGLAAILASAASLGAPGGFPSPRALGAVLGTVAVLVAGAAERDAVDRPSVLARTLAVAPLQRVGRLSYSWYLWHWPVLVLLAAVYPTIGLGGRIAGAIVALALAALTYALVENPIRRATALQRAPRRSLVMAGALACFSVSLVLGADRLARRAMTSPPQSTFARAEQDFSPVDFTCTTSSADDPTVRTCKFDYAAGTSPGASVVLFGDSHAAQWFPAADSIARLRHWTLVTVLKAACSPASIRIYSDRTGRDNTACTAWRDSALALIGALRPSLVLMSTAVHYLTLDGKQIRPVTRDEWDDGVRATLQRLAAVGARTVFFRDPPTPGFMVPECLSRAARPRAMSAPPQFPGCTSDRASTLDTVVFHAVIANATPSLSIADLSDQFCDAARCWPTRAGDVIFRDDNHITASYIAHLTSVVAQRLPPAESIPAAHGAGYATR